MSGVATFRHMKLTELRISFNLSLHLYFVAMLFRILNFYAICVLTLCIRSLASNSVDPSEISTSSSVIQPLAALPQNDTPVLPVYGKTRAGKGELIGTAVRFLTGRELDITSSSILSHTKTAKGYSASFGGHEILFYDTVGFGDSDCTDLPEESLLRMLEATGTQPFYPPLYILKDLDSTNVDALRKLTTIFPEVCVAVRGRNETFRSATHGFEAANISISEVFHLPEYLPDLPQTKVSYTEAVKLILSSYLSFTPTRTDLKFDAELFMGQVEKVKVKTKTRYENRVFEKHYKATETQITTKQVVQQVPVGYIYEKRRIKKTYPSLVSFLVNPIGSIIEFFETAFSPSTEDVKVLKYETRTETKQLPVTGIVSRKKVTTTRVTLQVDMYQVYKVLTGNIKIYMTNEVGEWVETGQEVIKVQDVRG